MSTEGKKRLFSDPLSVADRESCAKTIRNGGIAALISSAVTLWFALSGFFLQSAEPDLSFLLDPWRLVDGVLVIVLAIFVFRKSRVASTILLISFVATKAILWIDLGELKGSGITSLLFLYFYVAAMQGTYVWHSKYRESIRADA